MVGGLCREVVLTNIASFRGLNYNIIISNLLWVYKDPGNLVLVINSSDHEEKYFMEKFGLSPLPNLGTERYILAVIEIH